MRALIHIYDKHTYVRTLTHTHTHTYIHTDVHTYIHTRHTYTHTYIHTYSSYIHTHNTHIQYIHKMHNRKLNQNNTTCDILSEFSKFGSDVIGGNKCDIIRTNTINAKI
jgi:hypothetical protein